jgi:hypothetical protein
VLCDYGSRRAKWKNVLINIQNKIYNNMKETYTTKQAIELAEKERWMDLLLTFFPDCWGINLCSVESITVDRQEDGQITELSVKFIPNNSEEYREAVKLNCVN